MNAQEISKKVEKDLALAVKNVPEVARLYDKAIKGVMSYDEAEKFAAMLGEEIGNLLYSNLAEAFDIGSIIADDIVAIIPEALRKESRYVSQAVRAAQNTLNKKAGVGLKAIVPEFDELKAIEIAEEAVASGVLSGALPQMAQTLSQRLVDDAIQENAEAHSNLGLEATVIREYSDRGLHNGKDDCEFCLSREGTWTYQEAREHDVFRRHPGCLCKITYITKRSAQVQTNWRQNMWQEVGRRR